MSTLQVLIDARKLIEKQDRWFGGQWPQDTDPNRHCAGLAIIQASQKGTEGQGALLALEKVICCDVIYWNDHIDRTHAEVLAAYDAAIEAERTQQQTSAQSDGATE